MPGERTRTVPSRGDRENVTLGANCAVYFHEIVTLLGEEVLGKRQRRTSDCRGRWVADRWVDGRWLGCGGKYRKGDELPHMEGGRSGRVLKRGGDGRGAVTGRGRGRNKCGRGPGLCSLLPTLRLRGSTSTFPPHPLLFSSPNGAQFLPSARFSWFASLVFLISSHPTSPRSSDQ